jgi:hypothetical protein
MVVGVEVDECEKLSLNTLVQLEIVVGEKEGWLGGKE